MSPAEEQKCREPELELTAGQQRLVHDVITKGKWRTKGYLEIIADGARLSPDTLKIAAEADKANPVVAKPLWARFCIGLPGLLLVVSQLWFEPWNRSLGLGLEQWVPWLRFFALIIGGLMVVIAAPAPKPVEKLELKSGRRW